MTKKVLFALSFFLGLGFASLCMSHASAAASFNQNNLIDDAVFNNQGMNASQINSFLNTFSGSCISPNSGFATPDPTGWSATVNTNHGYTFGGNVTAGQAIYDAARIYDVNPEVLLATLQKEQSVLTGGSTGCHYTNPSPGEACPNSYGGGCVYIAMSYACPGGCSTDYSTTDGTGFHGIGNAFSLQLIAGTWLLRWSQERSLGIMSGYTGFDAGDDALYYSGPMTYGNHQRSNSSPVTFFDGTDTLNDGTSVTIGSGGTAALYYYTPFISGNRSFDTLFDQWFGTQFSTYGWQPVSQEVYTDASRSTPLGWNATLPINQTAYVVVIVANTGDTTWSNTGSNPVELGTDSPNDRNSAFCTGAWLSCNRPATLVESSVAPGQWGTFEFPITAPGNSGTYTEHYSMLASGLTWFNDPGASIQFTVQPIRYTWQPASQAVFADVNRTNLMGWSAWLVAGQTAYVKIIVINTSNFTWNQTGSSAVELGTSSPNDRGSPFCTSQWHGCNRPAILEQTSVPPGGWASFVFPITAPNTPGVYNEHFNLVGNSWFQDMGLSLQFNVIPRAYSWQVPGQAIYSDSNYTNMLGWGATLSKNQTAYAQVTAKNTGNFTWTNAGSNPIDLGTDNPTERQSVFCTAGWLWCGNRAARMVQSSVAPGQTATFEFPITAPSTAGTYTEHFNLVDENLAWFNDLGESFTITVQ